jgi:CDP-6-deoxy-D-xylo-4-hexulose-3-dehydrase
MLPNLIGNKPDWARLKQELKLLGREDIYLIEDSADTITETMETDVATTSFYASHVITAGGVGGMVMFNDQNTLLSVYNTVTGVVWVTIRKLWMTALTTV